jgi:hypothetical protein
MGTIVVRRNKDAQLEQGEKNARKRTGLGTPSPSQGRKIWCPHGGIYFLSGAGTSS